MRRSSRKEAVLSIDARIRARSAEPDGPTPPAVTLGKLPSSITQLELAAAIPSECQIEKLECEIRRLHNYRRLMGGVVHELKNPLEALNGVLYLLERKKSADGETQGYVELAKQELQRMQDVVGHTLSLSRQIPRPVHLSLAVVADTVLRFYDHKIKYKQVKIELQYRDQGAMKAVAAEIRQVLTNLIVNALEAVGIGGQVTIRVSLAHDWPNKQRRGVRLTLSDNGTGIAPEHLPHLFEGIFTTKDEKGTGLGLWVSAGIVEQHAGRLRVRSCTGGPHRGTTFSLFLPCESIIARDKDEHLCTDSRISATYSD